MKRLIAVLTVIMTIISAVPALAEDVILPHPGYFFGRNYDGYGIWFDEYPEAEYEAYVELLTGSYGMEISSETEFSNGKECFLRWATWKRWYAAFRMRTAPAGLTYISGET